MMFESLTPEVFDALIILNLAVGAILAGHRFLRDIRGPLPEEAPERAQALHSLPQANASLKDS